MHFLYNITGDGKVFGIRRRRMDREAHGTQSPSLGQLISPLGLRVSIDFSPQQYNEIIRRFDRIDARLDDIDKTVAQQATDRQALQQVTAELKQHADALKSNLPSAKP